MVEAVIQSSPPFHHGNCPTCGVSLDGGGIWQTFYDKTGSEAEADKIAEMYGASRTSGRWGRAIALYSMERDQTYAYRCPDCGDKWPRRA